MTAYERILRIKLSMWDAVTALCERLYEWRLTRGFVEYLAVKVAKREALSDIRAITNGSPRKEEDVAHLAYLRNWLAKLEQVETGEMSFDEFKKRDEIEWPQKEQEWLQLMARLDEIRDSK